MRVTLSPEFTPAGRRDATAVARELGPTAVRTVDLHVTMAEVTHLAGASVHLEKIAAFMDEGGNEVERRSAARLRHMVELLVEVSSDIVAGGVL